MENILEISNLEKRFGNVEALRDITFNVERGSITGFLGPNGAGKTTLLRIINGILAHDSGRVLVEGEEASLKVARKIGYMPEERGLYDNMTVEDQILYFGMLKGADKGQIRQVMDEYLQLFNIDGNRNRKLKELSKGNQQKVQIIATLVHEPSLVILDEPFSGFDPINGALLQDLIARLNNKGTTVILSSHNMHAVEEMCDSIALINHGELLLSGKIDDIKENNKTDELLVTTMNPLSLDFVLSGGKVNWIDENNAHKTRKGYGYRLQKKEGVANADLIHDLALQSDILHFEEALPSLNDIFIKFTTNQNTK